MHKFAKYLTILFLLPTSFLLAQTVDIHNKSRGGIDVYAGEWPSMPEDSEVKTSYVAHAFIPGNQQYIQKCWRVTVGPCVGNFQARFEDEPHKISFVIFYYGDGGDTRRSKVVHLKTFIPPTHHYPTTDCLVLDRNCSTVNPHRSIWFTAKDSGSTRLYDSANPDPGSVIFERTTPTQEEPTQADPTPIRSLSIPASSNGTTSKDS